MEIFAKDELTAALGAEFSSEITFELKNMVTVTMRGVVEDSLAIIDQDNKREYTDRYISALSLIHI